MPRPCKCRRVRFNPGVNYFKPGGIHISSLEEINLTIDEFEAIRLADLEGLYQEQAAERMNVSRQTFGNIIRSARQKITECIVYAKALKIEGGIYVVEETGKCECSDCNHEWELSCATGRPDQCPQCASKNIHRSGQDNTDATGPQSCGRKKCVRR